jgi:hypothetical protein
MVKNSNNTPTDENDITMINQDAENTSMNNEELLEDIVNWAMRMHTEIKEIQDKEKNINDLEYDIYLEIMEEGIYIMNEIYNLELIINEPITLEGQYGNILFFRHNIKKIWMLYNYITKVFMESPLPYITTIRIVSEDEIEITNGNNFTTIKFPNDEEMDKTIDRVKDDERDFFYYSLLESALYKQVFIVEMYNKKICFDLRKIEPSVLAPWLEVSYSKYHNNYIICAYKYKGYE